MESEHQKKVTTTHLEVSFLRKIKGHASIDDSISTWVN